MDPRLLDLLSDTIASVWAVELLLLLRQDASRHWQYDDLVGELRSSKLVVEQAVERLERGGLVVRNEAGSVSFGPASAELTLLVEELEKEYRSRPDLVRRTIVSGGDSKLRSFTNAFLFRKPPQ